MSIQWLPHRHILLQPLRGRRADSARVRGVCEDDADQPGDKEARTLPHHLEQGRQGRRLCILRHFHGKYECNQECNNKDYPHLCPGQTDKIDIVIQYHGILSSHFAHFLVGFCNVSFIPDRDI